MCQYLWWILMDFVTGGVQVRLEAKGYSSSRMEACLSLREKQNQCWAKAMVMNQEVWPSLSIRQGVIVMSLLSDERRKALYRKIKKSDETLQPTGPAKVEPEPDTQPSQGE